MHRLFLSCISVAVVALVIAGCVDDPPTLDPPPRLPGFCKGVDLCGSIQNAEAQEEEIQDLIDQFRAELEQQQNPDQIADLTDKQLSDYGQQYPGAALAPLIDAQSQAQDELEVAFQDQALVAYYDQRTQAIERQRDALEAQAEEERLLRDRLEEEHYQQKTEEEQRLQTTLDENYYERKQADDALVERNAQLSEAERDLDGGY